MQQLSVGSFYEWLVGRALLWQPLVGCLVSWLTVNIDLAYSHILWQAFLGYFLIFVFVFVFGYFFFFSFCYFFFSFVKPSLYSSKGYFKCATKMGQREYFGKMNGNWNFVCLFFWFCFVVVFGEGWWQEGGQGRELEKCRRKGGGFFVRGIKFQFWIESQDLRFQRANE